MKRGLISLITILSLFLVIVGCTSTTTTSKPGTFVGGTNGLDLSFISEEPPDRVLDDNQDLFYITVAIENKGEFDIPANKIIGSLSGIDKDSFQISSMDIKLNRDLPGVSKSRDKVIMGGEDELEFGQAKYKYDLNADFTATLRADVCYSYETKAVASICLKKNSAAQRDKEDVCPINNANVDLEVSGAPIQIASVDQRPSGSDAVRLTFDVVKKTTTGEVFAPDTFSNNCRAQEQKKNIVEVEVNSAKSSIPISCGTLGNSNKGNTKLADNKKTINCVIKTSGLQEIAFKTPINIEVRYFYKDAISKTLIVEDANK
ncbi:MAG: hypothetical protein NT139_02665 [Candidatus Woesearchaeota archaeon]|nr:hypothetical protein [Candidatus Woesearchaeota archaeon]